MLVKKMESLANIGKIRVIGGWSSASYIPHVGTPEYINFEREARILFDRFAKNGLIELKVTTLCFYGQLT